MKLEETLTMGNYRLNVECNDITYADIEFTLYDYDCHDKFPVLVLTLSPLWELEEFKEQMKLYKLEEKEKIKVKQIEKLFEKGDYYQSALNRSTEVEEKKVSYTSIAHQIIISNAQKLNYIKRIFSTSNNNYPWEKFITPDAIKFWKFQIEKGVPFSYFEKDNRYLLTLND